MQITVSTNKVRNKAADLKKMMQQAVCIQKPSNLLQNHFQKTLENKSFENQLANQKINLISNKSNKIIHYDKQQNKKKGLNTSLSSTFIKTNKQDKQNMCFNLHHQNPMQKPSTLFTNTTNSKSQKHLKLISNLQSQKFLNKTSSASSLNKQKIVEKILSDRQQTAPKKIHSIKFKNNQKTFTIEDFRLGKKLGKGRFGNVYLAQYKHNNFTLAIKIINIIQLKQAQMEQQLIQQIKIQTYLKHPNILKMYGFFNDEKNIYLLLQLGGATLFKQLNIKTFFTQQQAAYYIKQVIQSLKYLHNQNIIHRDIKPENILISQGVLKLSDFGWSIYSPTYKRQTFCGTLDYVPPEIVQGDYYDERVDIWSLGVLCYQLSTGKAPFEAVNNKQQTYHKILSVDLEFPEHLSAQLKDMISKILIKQPKNRLKIQQIENHPWLTKYQNVGRYISKQIWEGWQNFK